MCVIMYKPSGVPMPPRDALENAFDNNPDGIGYMFPTNGVVAIRKGYWNYNGWSRSFNYNKEFYGLDVTAVPLVVHARISTSGGVRRSNTHPFPLSRNEDELQATKIDCRTGVAHNGILSRPTGVLSDTQVFIRDILGLSDFDRIIAPDMRAMLHYALRGDKLAIMNYDGCVALFGDWTEGYGVKWSNYSYSYGKSSYTEGDWGQCPKCKIYSNLRKIGEEKICYSCLRTDSAALESLRAGIRQESLPARYDPDFADYRPAERRAMRTTNMTDIWGPCDFCGKIRELFENPDLGTLCKDCVDLHAVRGV